MSTMKKNELISFKQQQTSSLETITDLTLLMGYCPIARTRGAGDRDPFSSMHKER